jgi:hypothetical protein
MWTTVGALLMAWTLWMALTPDSDIALSFPCGDKLLHAFTFTCLMGWWGNIHRSRHGRIGSALLCLSFGIFIEFAQRLDPPRDADVLDVLADALGIALAWLLLKTPLGRVLTGVERKLGAPRMRRVLPPEK